MLTYTDPALVTGTRTDATAPNYGHTISGYGGKIPTAHWIHYAGRWHRIYVMCYSNSGTPYVVVKGERLILDIDTEYRFHN